ILRRVNQDKKLQGLGEAVSRIRRTQKGELLLQLKRSGEETAAFKALVSESVGDQVEVRSLSHKLEIECRDLDEITSKEEVSEAIGKLVESPGVPVSDILLRKAFGQTQTAIIRLPAACARKAMKVGWVRCRLRERSRGAALWSKETAPQDIRTSSEGFVRAKINGVTFYSCYAPPRWEISRYQRMLRSLVADARGRSPVVIGGDFNAWSPEWGSRAPNERGTSLLEHFAALDVVLANRGQKLTYSKAGRGSIIDITFVSSALIRRCNWEVSD
ncbi:hypothetical protein KR026_009514, partial [Drosophila bipectinata]